MKLTPKQQKFAEVYVECGNASEAYRQAYDVGVDTKNEGIAVNASKLLSDTNIALRIKNLQEELHLQNTITRQWIIDKYLRIINTHLSHEESVGKDGTLTAKDKEKIYTMSNSGYIKGSDVNTALKEVSRMLGLAEPDKQKAENQTINNIQINFKHERD